MLHLSCIRPTDPRAATAQVSARQLDPGSGTFRPLAQAAMRAHDLLATPTPPPTARDEATANAGGGADGDTWWWLQNSTTECFARTARMTSAATLQALIRTRSRSTRSRRCSLRGGPVPRAPPERLDQIRELVAFMGQEHVLPD